VRFFWSVQLASVPGSRSFDQGFHVCWNPGINNGYLLLHRTWTERLAPLIDAIPPEFQYMFKRDQLQSDHTPEVRDLQTEKSVPFIVHCAEYGMLTILHPSLSTYLCCLDDDPFCSIFISSS